MSEPEYSCRYLDEAIRCFDWTVNQFLPSDTESYEYEAFNEHIKDFYPAIEKARDIHGDLRDLYRQAARELSSANCEIESLSDEIKDLKRYVESLEKDLESLTAEV